jgi:hypothetical protein
LTTSSFAWPAGLVLYRGLSPAAEGYNAGDCASSSSIHACLLTGNHPLQVTTKHLDTIRTEFILQAKKLFLPYLSLSEGKYDLRFRRTIKKAVLCLLLCYSRPLARLLIILIKKVMAKNIFSRETVQSSVGHHVKTIEDRFFLSKQHRTFNNSICDNGQVRYNVRTLHLNSQKAMRKNLCNHTNTKHDVCVVNFCRVSFVL